MRNLILAVVLSVFAVLIYSGCDNRDPTGTSYEITLTADEDTLNIAGEFNFTTLRAQVYKAEGTSLSGATVTFQTDFGNVLGTGITDSNGFTESTFWFEGTNTGVANIRAQCRGAEAEIQIYVIDPNPYLLSVWAEPDTIYLGSSAGSSDITARLTDREGIPLPDKTIEFSTEEGFVSSPKITDANGYVETTYLFDGDEEMTVKISASYKNATSTTNIYIVEHSIVVLDIWAEEDTIYAGTNNNYTEIYASLKDGYENPVVDAYIYFNSDMGDIDNYGITDNSGYTNVDFWFNDREQTALITASYEGILDEISVTIMPLTYQIESVLTDALIIYADSDPSTYATITVQVLDGTGEPGENLMVHFTTSGGYLSSYLEETDENGEVQTHLHDSGNPEYVRVDISCENDNSYIYINILGLIRENN